MADILTMQDLANGHLDVKALGEAANGDENTTVTTRTGETYPSAAKTMRLIAEMGIGFTSFETKSLMTASAKADGAYAVVTNDEASNIGVYLKKSGAWVLVPWNNFNNLDGLRVNVDKDYPLHYYNNGGSINEQHPFFKRALVGVSVVNARSGYYYRIASIQNGQEYSYSTSNYGVLIERINIATGLVQELTTYNDYDVQLIPDRSKGGLQFFEIKCVADPLTTVNIVLDVDKLVYDGKAIVTQPTTAYGHNSIISTDCYMYVSEFIFNHDDMIVDYLYNGDTAVTYLSSSKWYKLRFKRKSVNLTMQNTGYSYAEAYTKYGDLIPPEHAVFTDRVVDAASDWHSPLQIRAANGSSNAAVIYTSGAHGKSGQETGEPTAKQVDLVIRVDGVSIDRTKNVKVRCKKVEIIATNFVMAYNTVDVDRYVLEQNYRYEITPKGQHVFSEYRALEDIFIEKDNGLQAYLAGMTPITTNTYLFVGDSQLGRLAMTQTYFSSGNKSVNPDVYGLIVRHPIAGDLAIWLDSKYGVGNREYLADNRPLFEHAVPTSPKVYGRLIDGIDLVLSKGKKYKWRGGLYWGMPTGTAYHDAILHVQDGVLLVCNDGSYNIV